MYYQVIIEMILALCALIMTACLISLTNVVRDDWKRLKRLEKQVYGKRDNRTK